LSSHQYRPAAVGAAHHGLAQHASNHRAAASTAARAGSDAGALADLLESFRTGLNRFDHRAFADLVAQASWFEIFNDRLLPGLLFQLVDDGYLPLPWNPY